jgi:hypothetical protein
MNSLLQKEVAGIESVQLFHQGEDIESENSKRSTNIKAWIKRFFITRFSFPLPI